MKEPSSLNGMNSTTSSLIVSSFAFTRMDVDALTTLQDLVKTGGFHARLILVEVTTGGQLRIILQLSSGVPNHTNATLTTTASLYIENSSGLFSLQLPYPFWSAPEKSQPKLKKPNVDGPKEIEFLNPS